MNEKKNLVNKKKELKSIRSDGEGKVINERQKRDHEQGVISGLHEGLVRGRL